MARELSPEGFDRSDRAGTSLASNIAPPGVIAPVKPAVSVLIVRDSGSDLEVFVQHRQKTMDFAAGVVVFPGGRVDDIDRESAAKLALPDSVLTMHDSAWSKSDTAGEPGFSRVLIATAQREVTEETGTAPAPDTLKPWANWITPPGRTRRFDTYFYAADGSDLAVRHQTTEATNSEWLGVEDILDAEAAEKLKLMRPTLVLLNELARFGSVDAVLSAERGAIDPVRPFAPGKHG